MTTQVTIPGNETGANPPAPPADQNAERPAWLPPEYKTPEEFTARFKEQQAEITRLQQAAKKPDEQTPPPNNETPPNDPPNEETPNEEDPAKKVADAAGVDLTSYQQVYAETGDVPEESRVELADRLKGVLGENARQLVDEYIEARKIVHQNDRQLFYTEAGGEQNYNAMVQWAAKNLSKEEAQAYNAQVNSGDRHATLFAINGLRAKYERANGREPTLINGGGGNPGAMGGYASSAEMQADMNNPKYKTDPAFRDRVAQKLKVSNW